MNRPSTLTRTVGWLLLAVGVGVCLTPLKAQSKDVATAIEVEGQVSVARSGQVALFQNSTVGPQEVIMTGPDGHAVFRISDGSTFEVFPNSRVTFRDSFNPEDLVNLILGKIRVMIEHRNGPNHKKVSTPTAVISVRGTVFDVSVEDDDGTTLVSVEEGEVEVRNTRQPGPTRTLNENESIRIFPNQPLAKVGGTSPAVQIIWDRVKGIVADVVLRNPGGVGLPRGGPGGLPGGQADGGKKKNPAPGAPPPGTPPPPPGGGI
jgi:FecR protein